MEPADWAIPQYKTPEFFHSNCFLDKLHADSILQVRVTYKTGMHTIYAAYLVYNLWKKFNKIAHIEGCNSSTQSYL